MSGHSSRRLAGPLILAGFVLAGLVMAIWQPVEPAVLLEWGRWLTAHPAAPALLVLAMALMFTVAFPGSLILWLVAPFQPPFIATLVMVAGSVLGALGAYLLARKLGADEPPGPRGRRIRDFLTRRSDLATQCALRLLPGFPHSAVNYAGGLLKLSLPRFLLAAVLGLTVKWGIYATAIHRGVAALERGDVIGTRDLLPLFLLALLLLAGAWVRRSLERR
jgi:uncharacterized membrane protein YdjX (TVP38/TMEM64 family)